MVQAAITKSITTLNEVEAKFNLRRTEEEQFFHSSAKSWRHFLLTAKVPSADRRQFADLGISGVIAKPFEPLTLAEQVASTLGWQS